MLTSTIAPPPSNVKFEADNGRDSSNQGNAAHHLALLKASSGEEAKVVLDNLSQQCMDPVFRGSLLQSAECDSLVAWIFRFLEESEEDTKGAAAMAIGELIEDRAFRARLYLRKDTDVLVHSVREMLAPPYRTMLAPCSAAILGRLTRSTGWYQRLILSPNSKQLLSGLMEVCCSGSEDAMNMAARCLAELLRGPQDEENSSSRAAFARKTLKTVVALPLISQTTRCLCARLSINHKGHAIAAAALCLSQLIACDEGLNALQKVSSVQETTSRCLAVLQFQDHTQSSSAKIGCLRVIFEIGDNPQGWQMIQQHPERESLIQCLWRLSLVDTAKLARAANRTLNVLKSPPDNSFPQNSGAVPSSGRQSQENNSAKQRFDPLQQNSGNESSKDPLGTSGNAKADALQQVLDETLHHLDATKKDAAEKQHQIESLQQDVRDVEKQAASARQAIVSARARERRLAERIGQLEEETESLRLEASSLRQHLSKATTRLQELQEESSHTLRISETAPKPFEPKAEMSQPRLGQFQTDQNPMAGENAIELAAAKQRLAEYEQLERAMLQENEDLRQRIEAQGALSESRKDMSQSNDESETVAMLRKDLQEANAQIIHMKMRLDESSQPKLQNLPSSEQQQAEALSAATKEIDMLRSMLDDALGLMMEMPSRPATHQELQSIENQPSPIEMDIQPDGRINDISRSSPILSKAVPTPEDQSQKVNACGESLSNQISSNLSGVEITEKSQALAPRPSPNVAPNSSPQVNVSGNPSDSNFTSENAARDSNELHLAQSEDRGSQPLPSKLEDVPQPGTVEQKEENFVSSAASVKSSQAHDGKSEQLHLPVDVAENGHQPPEKKESVSPTVNSTLDGLSADPSAEDIAMLEEALQMDASSVDRHAEARDALDRLEAQRNQQLALKQEQSRQEVSDTIALRKKQHKGPQQPLENVISEQKEQIEKALSHHSDTFTQHQSFKMASQPSQLAQESSTTVASLDRKIESRIPQTTPTEAGVPANASADSSNAYSNGIFSNGNEDVPYHGDFLVPSKVPFSGSAQYEQQHVLYADSYNPPNIPKMTSASSNNRSYQMQPRGTDVGRDIAAKDHIDRFKKMEISADNNSSSIEYPSGSVAAYSSFSSPDALEDSVEQRLASVEAALASARKAFQNDVSGASSLRASSAGAGGPSDQSSSNGMGSLHTSGAQQFQQFQSQPTHLGMASSGLPAHFMQQPSVQQPAVQQQAVIAAEGSHAPLHSQQLSYASNTVAPPLAIQSTYGNWDGRAEVPPLTSAEISAPKKARGDFM